MARTLSGGCSCGRNHYIVKLPEDATSNAQVLFDHSHNHRRNSSSLLSAYLRVPLPWLQSTTYALYPDETHSTIRRVYTSPSDTSSKRNFCGFCGTQLSHWTESPASEAEFIFVTLGSLSGNDLHDLGELGLLPREALDEQDSSEISGPGNSGPVAGRVGVPWFEDMVQGSGLERVKRSMGSRKEGNTTVDWEIIEWEEGDDAQKPTVVGKRKLETLQAEEDSVMEGLH